MPLSIDEVSFTLELPNLPSAIKKEIGNLIVEEIMNDLENKISPVDGSKFEPLSEKYAKFKKIEVGNKDPNLELYGDLKAAILSRSTRDGVEIYIKGKETPKAFNHNVGDTVPKRQFIPDEDAGETFRSAIMDKISGLIEDEVGISLEDLQDLQRSNPDEVSTDLLLQDEAIRKLLEG